MTSQPIVSAIMAVDGSEPPLDDLPPEEARRRLVRLITHQDMTAHGDIYEELEDE